MTCVLRRIYVHNYKCLQNFELELQETVLLLGANGAGKTAVLDIVYGLRKLLSAEAKITDEVAFHPATLTRWQTDPKQVFEIDVEVGAESFRYRLEIEHTDDGRQSRVVWESLGVGPTMLFKCDMGDVTLYRDDGSEGPTFKTDWTESALARVVAQPINTRLTAFKDAMGATVVCDIRPALLRAESTREDRLLARHAENFVDWYRHAVQENPASSVAHVEALRTLIDGFNNVHLQQSGLDSRALMLDFAGDAVTGGPNYRLRFDEMSDGQRALVVLYALLHLRQADAGVVLFLDEPDNFLTLAEIQPWLLELVALCDNTASQAVVCSHHPELIDYLGPDRGVLFVRESSTAVSARPLEATAANDGLKLSEQLARGWYA
jgi:predicted ATPase